LAEKLKKNGAFYFNTFAGHKEIDEDSFMSLAESVESEEVDFAVRDNKVSFVKDGMFILKKDGNVYKNKIHRSSSTSQPIYQRLLCY
jgi:hypothetical protein